MILAAACFLFRGEEVVLPEEPERLVLQVFCGVRWCLICRLFQMTVAAGVVPECEAWGLALRFQLSSMLSRTGGNLS